MDEDVHITGNASPNGDLHKYTLCGIELTALIDRQCIWHPCVVQNTPKYQEWNDKHSSSSCIACILLLFQEQAETNKDNDQ